MQGGQQSRRDADHVELPVHIHFDATTTSYKMKISQTVVFATSENADGSAILYLPPVTEAVGKKYYICAPTGATGGDISVYTREAGTEVTTYGDLDADDDHVIFFSDGKAWRMVFDGVA